MTKIHHDAVKPSRELGSKIVASDMSPDPYKRLLDHILGLLLIPERADREGKGVSLMTRNQFLKGLHVTGLASNQYVIYL